MHQAEKAHSGQQPAGQSAGFSSPLARPADVGRSRQSGPGDAAQTIKKFVNSCYK